MDNLITWSDGIEYVLSEISKNASLMSEYHKKRYYYFKGHLKYFRIPTIVFSAMNSVFSVGLQPYCPQSIISLICCFISLVCGIISSVELFLSVQATMETELISSKDFYLLSIDIFKILSLERANRMVNANSYLDDKYQTYCKLIENSNLLDQKITHELKPLSQLSPKLYLSETAHAENALIKRTEPTLEEGDDGDAEDAEDDIEMCTKDNNNNIKINIDEYEHEHKNDVLSSSSSSSSNQVISAQNAEVVAQTVLNMVDAVAPQIKIPRKYVKKNK
jgi:hypothetical protein